MCPAGSSLLNGLYSSWGEWGPLSIALRGCLIAAASLVTERVLSGAWDSVVAARGPGRRNCQALEHRFSSAVHGCNCSRARRIFPDQGSNP